jgi:nucleotide-binding universal stress UspA family protein
MKKILIPVDFSDQTDIVCSYALELAAQFESEIHLFHTFFNQMVIAEGTLPDAINVATVYNDELMKEIRMQSERVMEALTLKVKSKAASEGKTGITVTSAVVGGDVENELLVILDSYQPDLIVIGSHGKGKNTGTWGSVSRFVIHHSPVPVMVIPYIPEFLGFGSIMLTVGYEKSNTLMLSRILEIFNSFRPVYHCVHFLSEKDEVIDEKIAAMKIEYEEEVASGKMHFGTADAGGDIQKAIQDFISSRGITLIAFEPHKHSIFYGLFTKNITKKHLFATNMPLLAVPMLTESEA